MAKTSRELLTEAARIINQIVDLDPTGPCNQRLMRERAEQWLQEELHEEGGDSPSPSEELPTDDRWMAAYLKGLDVAGAFVATQQPAASQHGVLLGDTPDFSQAVSNIAKSLADNALAAAREQAKEN